MSGFEHGNGGCGIRCTNISLNDSDKHQSKNFHFSLFQEENGFLYDYTESLGKPFYWLGYIGKLQKKNLHSIDFIHSFITFNLETSDDSKILKRVSDNKTSDEEGVYLRLVKKNWKGILLMIQLTINIFTLG